MTHFKLSDVKAFPIVILFLNRQGNHANTVIWTEALFADRLHLPNFRLLYDLKNGQ